MKSHQQRIKTVKAKPVDPFCEQPFMSVKCRGWADPVRQFPTNQFVLLSVRGLCVTKRKSTSPIKYILVWKRTFGNCSTGLAVYFLNHPSFRGLSPSMSTFLSAGVMNGLQNRMANDPNFWRDLNQYAVAGAGTMKGRDAPNPQRIKEELDKLKAVLAQKLASPFTTMTA